MNPDDTPENLWLQVSCITFIRTGLQKNQRSKICPAIGMLQGCLETIPSFEPIVADPFHPVGRSDK